MTPALMESQEGMKMELDSKYITQAQLKANLAALANLLLAGRVPSDASAVTNQQLYDLNKRLHDVAEQLRSINSCL